MFISSQCGRHLSSISSGCSKQLQNRHQATRRRRVDFRPKRRPSESAMARRPDRKTDEKCHSGSTGNWTKTLKSNRPILTCWLHQRFHWSQNCLKVQGTVDGKMRNHAFFLSALPHGKSSILAPDSSLEPSFLTDKSFPRSKSEGPRPFFNRGQATGGLCADLGAVTLRRLSCRGQNAKEVRWKRDQNMKDPGLYYVQGRESSWLNFYEGEVHGLFSQAKSPDFFLCLTG